MATRFRIQRRREQRRYRYDKMALTSPGHFALVAWAATGEQVGVRAGRAKLRQARSVRLGRS
jgi:hypothetical protein